MISISRKYNQDVKLIIIQFCHTLECIVVKFTSNGSWLNLDVRTYLKPVVNSNWEMSMVDFNVTLRPTDVEGDKNNFLSPLWLLMCTSQSSSHCIHSWRNCKPRVWLFRAIPYNYWILCTHRSSIIISIDFYSMWLSHTFAYFLLYQPGIVVRREHLSLCKRNKLHKNQNQFLNNTMTKILAVQ